MDTEYTPSIFFVFYEMDKEIKKADPFGSAFAKYEL